MHVEQPGRHRSAPSTFRTDIGALRAVAVVMILVYHLWPGRLSGGYAGVDVFFVISGFLITSHLLLRPPTGIRGLLMFWSRRIRRLLPAACLVLAATLVASRLVAPSTTWQSTADHVKAAALYFVNWRLAAESVDYLAREDSATPVEHYWTLSVEEQFYLVWPVLIVALIGVALFAGWRRLPVVTIGLGTVVLASLLYSIGLTGSDPARAYFVTPTRLWELGAGGLLAALLVDGALGRRRRNNALTLPPAIRSVLAWVGLAAIVWTAFGFTAATPFPSWRALLPVGGAALVIAAYAPVGHGSPARIMAWRPVQWLGEVSYSIYLWHWPLIVLVPYVSGGRLGLLDKVTIIVVTLALAGMTKKLVEDPFRTGRWGRPLYKPYLLGASLMAVVVAASGLQVAEVNSLQAQAAARASQAADSATGCFGAAAMAPLPRACPPVTAGPLTPSPIQAKKDMSLAYPAVSGKKSCLNTAPDFQLVTCTFGDADGPITVALAGNSHAASFLPSLTGIAEKQDWRIRTYLAAGCPLTANPPLSYSAEMQRNCERWGEQATAQIIADHVDLVVMENLVGLTDTGAAARIGSTRYEDGFRIIIQRFLDAGIPVVVIRDTPHPGDSIPDCLAAHPDDYARCDGKSSEWVQPDPSIAAVRDVADPRAFLLDLTDYLCTGPRCFAVIGGVPVYFDGSHLTATYARTLAPYIEPTLTSMIG